MNRALACCLLTTTVCLTVRAETGPASPTTSKEESPSVGGATVDLAMGGTGGAYFLASPGELVVEVVKRDRNRRGGRRDLRAILVGPDRCVLRDVTLPDDDQPKGSGVGPPRRARLSTHVRSKGVYGLNVTVSGDRYGDDVVWGFRTNCPRYLIETSRGHRDERHSEPIVLLNRDRPGDVCFVPRKGAFDVEVAGLPKGVKDLPVYDAKGALIETIEVGADGRAAHTFEPDTHRDAVPWRLHLPKQQATVQIDGVTRWGRGDLYPDLSYWTPEPSSWFPLRTYRWILTPYNKTVYGRPGDSGEVSFKVHNNAPEPKTVQLCAEFPEGAWPVRLSAERVEVRPGQTKEVTIGYTVPAKGATRVCHLRATPADDADFSTYSTLTVKAGIAPATRPLSMPLVLKPYEHENEQFGYVPDGPVDWERYFDLDNRPFVRSGSKILARRDGQWISTDLRTAVTSRVPEFGGTPSEATITNTKIAFDRDNDLYLMATFGSQAALLHSNDGARTFSAYGLGRSGGFDIEQFSGHNVPDGPPAILRSVRTASDKKLRWRTISTLELFVPRKDNGRLTVGDPILVSRQSLGVGAHSGVPSAVVSRGDKVHMIWAEATDPKIKVPGVPTYVTTYDRKTGVLKEPVLVGYGAPPNDVHNRPCITMDSQGFLHVLTGTHGQPFHYARSLKANDAHSGWTQAEPVGRGLRQTYIGLVCGPDDTLHLVFRLWRHDPKYFASGATFATLAYQRKRPGHGWEPPRILIVPPLSEYSIFYHRLTIDRKGRLLLSYDYWSTYWFYRTDHFGRRRALMTSSDGGETWKLE
ncbi:MAG: BNR-4 repeat-containing protein [Phycisphaerae bacterium]|nr:BNR-4 repeat-containing protein [Phycisphaerae bacterium]